MKTGLFWILGLGGKGDGRTSFAILTLSQATLHSGIIAGAPGPPSLQPGLGVPLQRLCIEQRPGLLGRRQPPSCWEKGRLKEAEHSRTLPLSSALPAGVWGEVSTSRNQAIPRSGLPFPLPQLPVFLSSPLPVATKNWECPSPSPNIRAH